MIWAKKQDFSAIMDIFSQLLEDTGCLIEFSPQDQGRDFLQTINVYSKEIKTKFNLLEEQISVQSQKIGNLFTLIEVTLPNIIS
jgi:hypothetical protein